MLRSTNSSKGETMSVPIPTPIAASNNSEPLSLADALNEVIAYGPNFDEGGPKTEAQAIVLNAVATGAIKVEEA